jgi:transposase
MVKLKATTGGLVPKAQGNGGGHGKLAALKDWVARRIAEKRDLTAAGLAAEIATTHGMAVHRGSVWPQPRGRVSDLLCIFDLVHPS